MKPAFVLVASCLLTLSAVAAATTFPAPDALPARPDLPDPLVMLDARAVATQSQWFHERRPELKALFQHYMYGHFPPAPKSVKAELRREDSQALNGKATLKEITLTFGPPAAPKINLLLVIPNARQGRVPVILGLNFCGNHTVLDDPRIALPTVWMPNYCPGCSNNAATDAGRGQDAPSWDIAQVIDRGYALATFYHGDIDSDRPDATDGLRAFTAKGGMRGWLKAPRKDTRCPACPARYENGDYDWGTLASWAWGLERAVDYLVKDKAIDKQRIAVFGHSRNGKTALLAGAFDERIGLILCHQAGCGGSAPSRGKVGESVKAINDHFPHWFNAAFKQFNDAPERLPFDQHELIALCAPRPVLLSNATEDQWANPQGQFDMVRAVDSLYRWLAGDGLAVTKMPETGHLVASRLGYFIRPGKHSTRPEDWKAFCDFADAQWGPAKAK